MAKLTMSHFDKYPNQFRLLLGMLFLYLFSLAAINFYYSSSSPTDENLFTNPPSEFYIVKNFPATLLTGKEKVGELVQVGDLLLAVGQRSLVSGTEDDIKQTLEESADSTVEIDVFRLSTGGKLRYQTDKANIPAGFFRRLGPTVRVTAVTPGGASDRAGMKVGDLIIRINGRRFSNMNDADRVMRMAGVGKQIEYEVIRNKESLTLKVTLAAFGVQIGVLLVTLSGVLYVCTGIFLGIARPRFIAARLASLSFMLVGFVIMTAFNRRGTNEGIFSVFFNNTLLASFLFAFPITFHSGMYFPKERQELLAKKWIILLPYSIAAVFLGIIALVNNATNIVIGVITLFGYIIVLGLLYRKQASEEYRKLNRIIKITSIVVGVSTVTLGAYIQITQNPGPQWLFSVLLSLIPAAHLYTIGRYRLLDMDLRVRRNVQYTVVTALWSLALIVLTIKILLMLPTLGLPTPNIRLTSTSVEVLDAPLDPQARQLIEKGVLMFLAVGISLVVWRIGRRGQRFIDKKFYRAQYDYRRAASELAEIMATKLTMADLAQGMVEKLTELIRLKRAGVLFFRGQKECCCQEAHGFDGEAWRQYCLTAGDDLVKAIQQFQGEFSVDYLPADIKEQFRKNEFLYIVPIRSKQTLVGAIFVGEKLSEATFQHEDLEFLAAVAKQASVAIENAFLYEELAEQERMKHELAIARRIQLASLPQHTPNITGLDIAGTSIPALEVGGDYFDYLNGEAQKLTVIVGDVSGKGTSAALYMSKVQGILRSLHAFGLSPRDLFIRTNKLLCNDIEKKSFVTVIGGFFDTSQRKLTLARAGHLPLYYYNAKSRSVEIIIPKGLGLGLEAEKLFALELEERDIPYNPDDVFIFISDGITEAQRNGGAQFGEENLIKQLERYSYQSAEQIRDKIITAVTSFVEGNEQHDDQTIVVVKVV